jgi:hypothetical protein
LQRLEEKAAAGLKGEGARAGGGGGGEGVKGDLNHGTGRWLAQSWKSTVLMFGGGGLHSLQIRMEKKEVRVVEEQEQELEQEQEPKDLFKVNAVEVGWEEAVKRGGLLKAAATSMREGTWTYS